jgi:hypothetical protein
VYQDEGRVYVHYGRTRLYLDRRAWEALPGPEDVLVQRIAPAGAPAFTIALTRAELERTFGEVRQTRSWDADRCYHFVSLPPAVESFRVVTRRGAPPVATPPDPTARTAPAPPLAVPVSQGPGIQGWAAHWAARTGGVAESAAYLASVAAWRDAWRPEPVRALLVAESHVAEVAGDDRVRVQVPGVPHLPASFCRLVYCLGYGESDLCRPSPAGNGGTWQYWDIFGAIAGGVTPKQPRKGESRLEDRLRWKLEVLRWLRDHGVWLVDACVAGVYRPGGERAVSGRTYDEMVRESFEQFVWPSVAAEPIEQVWVIGESVRGALRGHPSQRSARSIAQPQGDRSSPGRHARELAEMVDVLRSIVPERRGRIPRSEPGGGR